MFWKYIGFLTAKDIADNVTRYGHRTTRVILSSRIINKDGIITEADKADSRAS